MTKAIGLKDLLSEKGEELLSQINFEQGLKLMEELVFSVESGKLPLDQAVGSYEKGVVLLGHLRALLSGAESKLKVLQKEETK